MNPFYGNDKEDDKAYRKMVVLCVAAASLVMLLFLLVLYMNAGNKKKQEQAVSTETEQTQADDIELGTSNLVSSDLDFWDMYTEEEPKPADEDTHSVSANFVDKKTETEENPEKQSMTDKPEDVKGVSDNELNDGKHIAIADKDGNKIWYELLDSVPKNTYQFEQYLQKDGEKLSYAENGKSSAFGIDVSKHQGEIDWALVKESGVEFAMLRVAARGYGSGQLLLDDNFVKNADNASKNGIKLGVYVYSQACSEIEAIEEANFAVAAVSNYKITYPIACDIETVDNDTARGDKLTVEERTSYVKTFCDTVKSYGYKPVIYADRAMLITKLDMEKLKDYDIWLAESTGAVDGSELSTDFPYQFTMWQYAKSGSVNGVSGSVDLNISFVNYEEK